MLSRTHDTSRVLKNTLLACPSREGSAFPPKKRFFGAPPNPASFARVPQDVYQHPASGPRRKFVFYFCREFSNRRGRSNVR